MIERFGQELDCSTPHGLNTHAGVSVSGDEDDRHVAILFLQPGLQIQTRHFRHTDVNDQARSLVMQIGFEEFFGRSKAPGGQSCCLHQVVQRILHGLIVIDDCYQFGCPICRHMARVESSLRLEQPNFGRAKLDLSKQNATFDGLAIRCREAGLISFHDLSLSAILTRSGKDLACIFFMT
jgi:hypothetical protein